MSQIDWSKAPEGATHFDPVDQNWLRQFSGTCLNWLNGSGWSIKGWQYPNDLSEMGRLIQRPPQQPWTGEGIPTVGSVVNLKCRNIEQGPVTVLYISDQFAVFDSHRYGHEQGGPLDIYTMTPIRTPEQIAAEARAAGIREIRNAAMNLISLDAATWIWDAGYRKVVKP